MVDQVFTSNKPYLFRAIYSWLLDNEATPYVLVDASRPNVEVPTEHIKDGQIVLNVSPAAVQGWHVDNHAISFSARFGGVARQIYVPMYALMAVYSQENGLGMAFPAEEDESRFESASESESKDQTSLKRTQKEGIRLASTSDREIAQSKHAQSNPSQSDADSSSLSASEQSQGEDFRSESDGRDSFGPLNMDGLSAESSSKVQANKKGDKPATKPKSRKSNHLKLIK